MIPKNYKKKATQPKAGIIRVASRDYRTDKTRYVHHVNPEACKAVGLTWTTLPNRKDLTVLELGLLHVLMSKPANHQWREEHFSKSERERLGLSVRELAETLTSLDEKGVLERPLVQIIETNRWAGTLWSVHPLAGFEKVEEGTEVVLKHSSRGNTRRNHGVCSHNIGKVNIPIPKPLSEDRKGASNPLPSPPDHPDPKATNPNHFPVAVFSGTLPPLSEEDKLKYAIQPGAYPTDEDLGLTPGLPVIDVPETPTIDTPGVIIAQVPPSHAARNPMLKHQPITLQIDHTYTPGETNPWPCRVSFDRADFAVCKAGTPREIQAQWVRSNHIAKHLRKLDPACHWDGNQAKQLMTALRRGTITPDTVQTVVKLINMHGGMNKVLPKYVGMKKIIANWDKLLTYCQTCDDSCNAYAAVLGLDKEGAFKELRRMTEGRNLALHFRELGAENAARIVEKNEEEISEEVASLLKHVNTSYKDMRPVDAVAKMFQLNGENNQPAYSSEILMRLVYSINCEMCAKLPSKSLGPQYTEIAGAEFAKNSWIRKEFLNDPRLGAHYLEGLARADGHWHDDNNTWGPEFDVALVSRIELARSEYLTDLVMLISGDRGAEDVERVLNELAGHGCIWIGLNDQYIA